MEAKHYELQEATKNIAYFHDKEYAKIRNPYLKNCTNITQSYASLKDYIPLTCFLCI
jgi:hypothetical protein